MKKERLTTYMVYDKKISNAGIHENQGTRNRIKREKEKKK